MRLDLEEYKATIKQTIEDQRCYFDDGKTRSIDFRITALNKLYRCIVQHQNDIAQALKLDLSKSVEESYMTEISMVLSEIKNYSAHLKTWSTPRKVSTPFYFFPSTSRICYEPLGVTLILSPWNYPFQLLMLPLIGAISAGNCAVLKPSSSTPNINKVIEMILHEVFLRAHVSMIEGDREETLVLLQQKFDFIFFTGSPKFGKEVMQCAAQNLTPVVLELGGKSPCIVDEEANLAIAARRIVWGKLLNAGQTCIAPDYFYVHRRVIDPFIEALKNEIVRMYGVHAQTCSYYPRIINEVAMRRLISYLDSGEVVYGGGYDIDQRYFEPTILRHVSPQSAVMSEEIFGPIFPLLAFDHLASVVSDINSRPKPLAFYYFGRKQVGWDLIKKTSSGGACINDVVIHQANHHMPFGGVGNSGMGKYHGKYSYRVFSNERSITQSSTLIDIALKYPPFKYFKLVKRIL